MRTTLCLVALAVCAFAATPTKVDEKKIELHANQVHQDIVPLAGSTKCIILLLTAYVFFFSGVALMKMFLDWNKQTTSPLLEILDRGTKVVDLAPQLAVLFLACRLRAVYLSTIPTSLLQTSVVNPDLYDLPTPFTQTSMVVASSCLLTQGCFTLLTPLISGEYSFGASSLAGVAADRKGLVGAIQSVRALVALAMYVFTLIVVYEIINMKAPAALWKGQTPPVSPAVECTMILTCTYFIAFCLWDSFKIIGTFIAGSNEDGSPRETFLTKYEQILSVGVDTMQLAPMICVLILAVRMRALGMGLNGPQSWAQDMMYFTTIGMITSVVATVVGPLIFGARARRGVVDGDVTFEMNNTVLAAVFTILRYVCIFAIYCGLIAVVVSTFIIEAPGGRDVPMSTALATTLVMTDMFFTVYCGIWLSATLKQFFGPQGQVLSVGPASMYDTLIMMFDGARTSLQFIPMISILFMAARLRAMQVVGKDKAPQTWAQHMMWFTVAMIVISGALGFFQPLCGFEGNRTCVAVNDIIRLLTIVAIHGGAISVVVSMYLLNPSNAGSLGLRDPIERINGEVISPVTDTVGLTM